MEILPYKQICQFKEQLNDDNKGLIILFQKKDEGYEILHEFEQSTRQQLLDFLKLFPSLKNGDVSLFTRRPSDKQEYNFIACALIEEPTIENVRKAAACALKMLKAAKVNNIFVSTNFMPEEMAIGSYLSAYKYSLLLKKQPQRFSIAPHLPCENFERGAIKAYHQNFARFLADSPANLMTPSLFVEYAKDFLNGTELEIQVYDEKYLKDNKMNMFLSVTEGSEQPPQFLVIKYKGRNTDEVDISLVGKGITFDSGGISIKPSANMGDMKADMMGAATVLATISLAHQLGMNINVTASIPLCENLPSGKASKPGDVRIAMNGLSIEVDNTDAEGRLVLGDAMTHAQRESPKYMIDVATLTGAICVALGDVFAGLYSNDKDFSLLIEKCGTEVNDEVWPMPLSKKYRSFMDSNVADMKNAGGRLAGSCTAAIFLNEFVEGSVKWAHLDIAGVMNATGSVLYGKGMTGKPVLLLERVLSTLGN